MPLALSCIAIVPRVVRWLAEMAKTVIGFQSKKSPVLWPSALWIVLAFPSLLLFLALSISGLVMNLGAGSIRSTESPYRCMQPTNRI
jgi:hypothetical protein